jgi:hypothetical protein
MNFPPQTPQDYCDYFEGMLKAIPPDPKWEMGFKAARSWRDYCEQNSGCANSQVIIPIVKLLMPVRYSRHLLFGLWQQVLGGLAKCSFREQKEIWLEVFSPANQGQEIITFNEDAHQLLRRWSELDERASSSPITETDMMDLVDEMYVYAVSSHEWFALTMAIDKWFKNHVDEPAFFDTVCIRFNKKSN